MMIRDRLKDGIEDPSLLEAIFKKLADFGKKGKGEAKNGTSEEKSDADVSHTQQILFYSPNEVDAIADDLYDYVRKEGHYAKSFKKLKAMKL